MKTCHGSPILNFVSTKVSKCIGIINGLKRFLPLHIRNKTLYFTFVHSYLNYSLLAWGFSCRRIKLLQKLVLFIIVSKYNDHTEPLMKTLSILNIEDVFKRNIRSITLSSPLFISRNVTFLGILICIIIPPQTIHLYPKVHQFSCVKTLFT